MERLRGLVPEHESFDEIFKTPPTVILAFDHFTDKPAEISMQIMETRCDLAVLFYHSDLYKTDEERPLIVSFAGVHKPGDLKGSAKVAKIVQELEATNKNRYPPNNNYNHR